MIAMFGIGRRLRSAASCCLAACVLLSGCGGGVEGTAFAGIDEESLSTVLGSLQSAGIDRRPEAIKDLGDHWLVALPGSGPRVKPTGLVTEDGEEEYAEEEPVSERVGARPAPKAEPTPESVSEVIVTKTGDVKLVR